jgi:hypothetical protein
MMTRFPPWARTDRPGDIDDDAAVFRAGAALAALDRLLSQPLPCHGAWLDRLALGAAVATAAQAGRPEQEGEIRDAYHHRQQGGEIGPAGRHYLFWRRLTTRSQPLTVEAVIAAAAVIDVTAGDGLTTLANSVVALTASALPPLTAAASAAELGLRLSPATPHFALWLADAVLAGRLGWPARVPLLAQGLRRLRPIAAIRDKTWPTRCAAAYAQAAAEAYRLAERMAARADTLLMAQRQIRAKETPAMVALLLDNDCVAPSAGPATMSDRARRRLLERLTALDAIRELSGRPSFRLYGL